MQELLAPETWARLFEAGAAWVVANVFVLENLLQLLVVAVTFGVARYFGPRIGRWLGARPTPYVTLRRDWNDNPPAEVWRRPCGLGWSSFAIVGSRLYTQEQLGKEEAVVCYDADSGREIWRHTDPVRLEAPTGRASRAAHDLRMGMASVECRAQSPGEEIANSVSHGLGAVLAAVFSPQLIANLERNWKKK